MSFETTRVETVRVRRLHPGLVAAAIVYSWVAASFDSFTTASALAVGFPGVLGVLTGASDWPADRDRPRQLSPWALLWVVWVVALALWEAYSFLQGSTPAHPTISVLLDPPLEVRVVRAAFFFGWMALGWRLLQR